MATVIAVTLVTLLHSSAGSITGLTYMDEVRQNHRPDPSSPDECKMLYWYPQPLPPHCYINSLGPKPSTECPNKASLTPPEDIDDCPNPPIPMPPPVFCPFTPVAMPCPISNPPLIFSPFPLQVPAPVPVPNLAAISMPGSFQLSAPIPIIHPQAVPLSVPQVTAPIMMPSVAMSQRQPSDQNSLLSELSHLMKNFFTSEHNFENYKVNILPFTDVFSEIQERMRSKKLLKKLRLFMKNLDPRLK